MRVIVIGAGGVGGVLGGELARAGVDVILVEKDPAHLAAIQRDGLRLRTGTGNHQLEIPAVERVAEAEPRGGDLIVVAVKAWDTATACEEIAAAAGSDVPVYCAQNGVRNDETAAQLFPDVSGMVVLFNGKRMQPGVVAQTLNGDVYVGSFPTGVGPSARAMLEALHKTELVAHSTSDLVAQRWNKLLLNANNATFGLAGLSSQFGRSDREARLWMADVFEEAMAALDAAGIDYTSASGTTPFEDRLRQIRSLDLPAPQVPEDEEMVGYVSMYQDLYHRRQKTEASYINGEIVRLGEQYGVSTPYNSLLLHLATKAAQAQELPGSYPIARLRELMQEQRA